MNVLVLEHALFLARGRWLRQIARRDDVGDLLVDLFSFARLAGFRVHGHSHGLTVGARHIRSACSLLGLQPGALHVLGARARVVHRRARRNVLYGK